MITKDDCMSILVKLDDAGLPANKYIRSLILSKEIPLEVLRFIAENRGIEVNNFYEMLRKRHNQHKSTLYTNIMKEQDDEVEITITLASMLTQIGLYGKKIDNPESFYREVRAEEISRALHTYFESGDSTLVFNLSKLIKSDILVLEYIAGRRELQQ